MQKYSGLKVLYKTFPGIGLRNDPIMEILSEELDQGRVKLTSKHPVKLMRVVDIVLFDMISTGFAEAVKIGTPTLVYNKEFDYEIASDEGKKINDKFENCGMVFSGLSPDGNLPEILELNNHPWFIGVQFHPELKSKPFEPHPLFVSFIKAALNRSRLV